MARRSPDRRIPDLASDPAEDLLARFRDGDEAAFEGLVRTYQARLIHFFYRLCWDRDRAEDFTQNLFLKLLRGAGSYRPEGKLTTFLYRVATNLWIDEYRALRPRGRIYSLDQALLHGQSLSTSSSSAGEASPSRRDGPANDGQSVLRGGVPVDTATEVVRPEAVAEQNEERRRLRAALEQLTEPHRLVFELAVYQELPYAEVSEVLGIPVGTVKSRMHNAVRALREILAEEDERDAGFRGSQSAQGGGAG
jgi:RNA polymerase sigma-70 factor (ECF subfamily)